MIALTFLFFCEYKQNRKCLIYKAMNYIQLENYL